MKQDKKRELLPKRENRSEIISDDRFKLNITFALSVGKYFESNNDYINMMKVNKKYKGLTEIYKYNPISDTQLFENIETQHIYNDSEEILQDKFQYINWTKSYIPKTINKRTEFTKSISLRYFSNYEVKEQLKNGVLVISKDFYKINTGTITFLSLNKYNNVKEIYLSDTIEVLENLCIFGLLNLEVIRLPRKRQLKVEGIIAKDCPKLKYVIMSYSLNIGEYNPFLNTALEYINLPSNIKLYDFLQFRNNTIKKIATRESVGEYRYVYVIVDISKEIEDFLRTNVPNYDSMDYVNEEIFVNEITVIFIYKK